MTTAPSDATAHEDVPETTAGVRHYGDQPQRDRDKGSYMVALAQQDDALAHLDQSVHELEQLLEPLCGPERPTDGGKSDGLGAAPPLTSPMTNGQKARNLRIEKIARAVDVLIDRLEL